VTKTETTSGCSNTDDVTVTVNVSSPTFTLELHQPSLCTQYGSVLITPTVAGSYHYSIDGGNTFTNTTGSFTNLVSGSVTGIQIKNDANGCSSTLLNCGDPSLPSITTKAAPETVVNALSPEPTVKAFPNPFSDQVKFVINSPAAGNGSLDIYNVMGQKVKSVYQGRVLAGNNSFEVTIPKKDQQTLIYMFRVGDKKVTGKLLQLNN
jgi:hypothetical protein